MSRHPPVAEDSDATAAKGLVEAEVLRVSTWAGVSPPLVRLVTGLGHEGLHGNTTAEIQSIRIGTQAELNMPFRVVKECSQPGWSWLVAHEVGHIVVRSSFSDVLRWALTGASFGLLLVGLLLVILSAISDYNGSEGGGTGMLIATLIGVSVASLSAGYGLRRREESNADRFAMAYLGDIRGAEEYFNFTADRQSQHSRSHRLAAPMLWLFRSHASPRVRLNIMRRELEKERRPITH